MAAGCSDEGSFAQPACLKSAASDGCRDFKRKPLSNGLPLPPSTTAWRRQVIWTLPSPASSTPSGTLQAISRSGKTPSNSSVNYLLPLRSLLTLFAAFKPHSPSPTPSPWDAHKHRATLCLGGWWFLGSVKLGASGSVQCSM